jgi:N-formylglutamate amidohydrolase
MTDIYQYQQGDSPLLISIPHAGEMIAPEMDRRLSAAGQSLIDTDWHVHRLYTFAKDMEASVLKANYSRYVVDLNRDKNDTDLYPGQVKTGLCPVQTFDGEDIYAPKQQPDENEIKQRTTKYWQPYHDKLNDELKRIKDRHGYALLFDAHSIKSEVPRLFEGRLPDLNLGTNYGQTCAPVIEQAVAHTNAQGEYKAVLNGRFVGGFITRNYGVPENNIHAIQMELIWDLYMDEQTLIFDEKKAAKLSEHLEKLLKSYIMSAAHHHK